MPTLVYDLAVEQQLLDDRRSHGLDRWDEVWEGTYVIMPLPNNEHQRLVARLTRVLQEVVEDAGLGQVLPGCNVSDRDRGWEHNYRCPDLAVYLRGNVAVDCGSHWAGGPDLAVEIVSPGDQTLDKLDFYGAVGTHELLVIEREPWNLSLFQWQAGRATMVAEGRHVATQSPALHWQLLTLEDQGPQIVLRTLDGQRQWTVST